MREAGCVLIVKNNKVLAVSRKDNPHDFGLPGGLKEFGEAVQEAAFRELKEETGLVAESGRLVLSDYCGNHLVSTFLVENYYGKISSNEAGIVAWIEPKDLLTGSFSEYNKKIMQDLGLLNHVKFNI